MWPWFRRKPEPLDLPPFPRLRWDRDAWSTQATFPGLAGFSMSYWSCADDASENLSDGTTALRVLVASARQPSPPSTQQVAAYTFLFEAGHHVREAILAAVFAEYAAVQESLQISDPAMPEISAPRDLLRLMGLGTIYLLPTAAQGFAYAGFFLGCAWDDEHGFGILTHRDRVVTVGENEIAWADDLARQDARRLQEE